MTTGSAWSAFSRCRLTAGCWTSCWEGLVGRGIVLYVDLSPNHSLDHQPTPESVWPVVYDLATAYPRLKIVLFGKKLSAHYMQTMGLLRNCPNISLDVSAMQFWRSTERICRRVGPDRLVFGSYMPTFHAAQFMIQIQ